MIRCRHQSHEWPSPILIAGLRTVMLMTKRVLHIPDRGMPLEGGTAGLHGCRSGCRSCGDATAAAPHASKTGIARLHPFIGIAAHMAP
jgi:hypothetical protein